MIPQQGADSPDHSDTQKKHHSAPYAVLSLKRSNERRGSQCKDQCGLYDDENESGKGGEEENEEGGIVSTSDAVVHPLAVVITRVHAVVACLAMRGTRRAVGHACRTVFYTYTEPRLAMSGTTGRKEAYTSERTLRMRGMGAGSEPSTSWYGGSGSRLRGRMPGSVKAVIIILLKATSAR